MGISFKSSSYEDKERIIDTYTDMQRAISYVHYHAKNYGYDEDKISAIGFSTGGALVCLLMYFVKKKI